MSFVFDEKDKMNEEYDSKDEDVEMIDAYVYELPVLEKYIDLLKFIEMDGIAYRCVYGRVNTEKRYFDSNIEYFNSEIILNSNNYIKEFYKLDNNGNFIQLICLKKYVAFVDYLKELVELKCTGEFKPNQRIIAITPLPDGEIKDLNSGDTVSFDTDDLYLVSGFASIEQIIDFSSFAFAKFSFDKVRFNLFKIAKNEKTNCQINNAFEKWYCNGKFDTDFSKLNNRFFICEYIGGHTWEEEFFHSKQILLAKNKLNCYENISVFRKIINFSHDICQTIDRVCLGNTKLFNKYICEDFCKKYRNNYQGIVHFNNTDLTLKNIDEIYKIAKEIQNNHNNYKMIYQMLNLFSDRHWIYDECTIDNMSFEIIHDTRKSYFEIVDLLYPKWTYELRHDGEYLYSIYSGHNLNDNSIKQLFLDYLNNIHEFVENYNCELVRNPVFDDLDLSCRPTINDFAIVRKQFEIPEFLSFVNINVDFAKRSLFKIGDIVKCEHKCIDIEVLNVDKDNHIIKCKRLNDEHSEPLYFFDFQLIKQ